MIKKFFLFLVLICWCGTAGAYNHCDDAVGCWLFDEGSGTTVADSSPNTNTGNFVASGRPAWASISGTDAPTYADYMVTYNPATGDYINCGADSSLDITGSISVCSWISLNDWSTQQILAKDKNTGGRAYTFDILGTISATHRFYINGGAGNDIILSSVYVTYGGIFRHIAATWNQSTKKMNIYVNGVADATEVTTDSTSISTATANVTLGKREYVGNEDYFRGDMSETGLFNTCSSSTEINDIMDNGLVGGGAPPTVDDSYAIVM